MKKIKKYIQTYTLGGMLSLFLHSILFGLTLYGYQSISNLPSTKEPLGRPIEIVVAPLKCAVIQNSSKPNAPLALPREKKAIKLKSSNSSPSIEHNTRSRTSPNKQSRDKQNPDSIRQTVKPFENTSQQAQYKIGSHLNPAPYYPNEARERGEEGTVIVLVHVDKNGSVMKLRIVQSSGYPSLDSSSLETLKTWIFTPGQLGNKKIESELIVPIQFVLDSSD